MILVSISRQQENGKQFKQYKANADLGKCTWNLGNRLLKVDRLYILRAKAFSFFRGNKNEPGNVSPSLMYCDVHFSPKNPFVP